MKLHVFIQTCAGREKALAATEQAVRASDVGSNFTVVRHPAGKTIRQFYVELLEQMAESEADFVIRLEDDILVNRHLAHNVATWGALQEKTFGCGWLFIPQGVLSDRERLGHTKAGWPFRKARMLHCIQGVVVAPKQLERLIPFVQKYYLTAPGNAQQDLSLSAATWDAGRRVFLHSPALVEHRINTKSTLGHRPTPNRTTGGLFSLGWRRGEAPAPERRVAAVSPQRRAPARFMPTEAGGLIGAMTMAPGGRMPVRAPVPRPAPAGKKGKRARYTMSVSSGLEGAYTLVPSG